MGSTSEKNLELQSLVKFLERGEEVDKETWDTAYREGYRAGWVAATNAIYDAWFLGKNRLYHILLDRWEGPLHGWVHHEEAPSLPPRLLAPRCAYCGKPAKHLDHVVPRSRGGSDDDDNLVPACARCNFSKGRKTPKEWLSIPASHREEFKSLKRRRNVQP